MKKYIALLMTAVLCIVSSFTLADAAAATQPPVAALGDTDEVDAFTFDEITSFTPGAFELPAYGFGLYVPADWTQLEISSDDAGLGVFYDSINAASDDQATAEIQLSMMTMEGATIEFFAEALATNSLLVNLDDVYINDVYFLVYELSDNNGITLTCEVSDSNFLSIRITYADADAASALVMLPHEIAASIYVLDDSAAD